MVKATLKQSGKTLNAAFLYLLNAVFLIKMKILLLSKYSRIGASSRVRSYQYVEYLKSKGLTITVSELFNDEYLSVLYETGSHALFVSLKAYARRLKILFSVKQYDLLWIEKELFPWLPAWAERLLKRLDIHYVVDYDDAIFHKYDISNNGLVRILLGRKIDVVMSHADMVIVGNEYLAKRAQRVDARSVTTLPTVVDTEVYRVKNYDNEKVVIGWIGTPITVKYFELISSALVELRSQVNYTLRLIGAGQYSLPGIDIDVVGWDEASEVEKIQRFDIGIMPLPDEPWERGKCGYKLIQYMACGKPVVASPVGVNSKLIEHGVDGYLANSTNEWVEALLFLVNNKSQREAMGIKARTKIEDHYSLKVMKPLLYEALSSA